MTWHSQTVPFLAVLQWHAALSTLVGEMSLGRAASRHLARSLAAGVGKGDGLGLGPLAPPTGGAFTEFTTSAGQLRQDVLARFGGREVA